MRKEDLVVLCYANNPCCTNVVALNEREHRLEVDLVRETWAFTDMIHLFRIGEDMNYYDKGCIPKNAVIGVYDRMNIKHLNVMVYHAREATRGPSYSED